MSHVILNERNAIASRLHDARIFISIYGENHVKKKIAFCILIFVILFTFTACSMFSQDEKTVTVKVFSLYTDNKAHPLREYVCEQNEGEKFSVEDYWNECGNNHRLSFSHSMRCGFYLDKECTKKFHIDTTINKDTSLYALYCSAGTKLIDFIFENEPYYYFVEDENATITLDMFVVSAYGKELDKEKLRFYSDSRFTRRLYVEGKTFETMRAYSDVEQGCTIKYVFVKLEK